MVFERIIEGKDHLWAVRDMSKPKNDHQINENDAGTPPHPRST
jgi:hypothetical protein